MDNWNLWPYATNSAQHINKSRTEANCEKINYAQKRRSSQNRTEAKRSENIVLGKTKQKQKIEDISQITIKDRTSFFFGAKDPFLTSKSRLRVSIQLINQAINMHRCSPFPTLCRFSSFMDKTPTFCINVIRFYDCKPHRLKNRLKNCAKVKEREAQLYSGLPAIHFANVSTSFVQLYNHFRSNALKNQRRDFPKFVHNGNHDFIIPPEATRLTGVQSCSNTTQSHIQAPGPKLSSSFVHSFLGNAGKPPHLQGKRSKETQRFH